MIAIVLGDVERLRIGLDHHLALVDRAHDQDDGIVFAPEACEEFLGDEDGGLPVGELCVRFRKGERDLLELGLGDHQGTTAVSPRSSAASSTEASRSAAHFAKLSVTALRRLACNWARTAGRT